MSCQYSSFHTIDGKNYAAELGLGVLISQASCDAATDCRATLSFLLEVSKFFLSLYLTGLCPFFGPVKHK